MLLKHSAKSRRKGMTAYRPIQKQDLPGVIELCRVENWTSYIQDPDRTWQVFTAPPSYRVRTYS
jgi:hypothetical protein